MIGSSEGAQRAGMGIKKDHIYGIETIQRNEKPGDPEPMGKLSETDCFSRLNPLFSRKTEKKSLKQRVF